MMLFESSEFPGKSNDYYRGIPLQATGGSPILGLPFPPFLDVFRVRKGCQNLSLCRRQDKGWLLNVWVFGGSILLDKIGLIWYNAYLDEYAISEPKPH